MIKTILSLFTGSIGTILNPYMLAIKVAIGGVIVTGLAIGYFSFVHHIQQAAVQQFRDEQLQQILSDKQKEVDDLKFQLKLTNDAVTQADKEKADLSASLDEIKNSITENKHTDDSTESDVLNTTLDKIRQLQEKQGKIK